MGMAWGAMGKRAGESGFWFVILGFLLMYGSTAADLMTTTWNTEQNGHGPFILLVSAGIALSKLEEFLALPVEPANGIGIFVFLIGVLFFVVGRSQDILVLETGSALWILVAIVLLFRGKTGLNYMKVPIAFLVFAVPMPGWFMDGITQPAKLFLSDLVVDLLFDFGYPVAQNGIVIYIAQYQLLVKDACVGLNSLYSLSAVGSIYIYMARPGGKLHLWTLIALILPIAFIANLIRVASLVLITYYLGEEAGNGFLHDFAGLVMFVTSLLLFIALDGLIYSGRLLYKRFLGTPGSPHE